MPNYYANSDPGTINQLAKTGHGEAAQDGVSASKRAVSRAMATEGQNVGGQADAQRAGHVANANAGNLRARNTSTVGSSYARGENEMMKTQQEGQGLTTKNLGRAEDVESSLNRMPNA